MEELHGIGVSSGIACGKIRILSEKTSVERFSITDVNGELDRYNNAVTVAKEQLYALKRKAQTEAEEMADLFETHAMMIDDIDYVDTIKRFIKEKKINAEAAVYDAGVIFSEMFSSMDDEYMKERSSDVIDISARIIRALSGIEEKDIQDDEPMIIVADDLSPSETMQLDKSKILAFVLRGGSKNGHTAILARTLGIPAIISVGSSITEYMNESSVIIDGASGQIFVEPDDETKSKYEIKMQAEAENRKRLEELKECIDITPQGKRIKLYANISGPDDIASVISNGAAGIGLFRSEFLYLSRDRFPTENEQFEAYLAVIRGMGDKRVIVRTLDIGADKKISYFNLPQEENPALGFRAIRICLSRTEILKTQLRALYRASAYGNLSIMFPMITSLWEIHEIKRICDSVKTELRREHILFNEKLEIGIMIETPAAVMESDELAKEVDFFSIGTNDLTQYTLAVDRQASDELDRFYDAKHPSIMKMIKITIENAHKENIWVGVCGELASDVSAVPELLEMGIDELSVSPRFVLPIRSVIINAKK